MGEEDIERQALNVFRMRLLGARVIPVRSGSRTLKDAMNEALRDWVTNVRTTYYLLGSALGPHPYPMMVRDLQSVIGGDARRCGGSSGGCPTCWSPAWAAARTRSASSIRSSATARCAWSAWRRRAPGMPSGRHGAPLSAGPGVLHGSMCYLLQDEDGQVLPAHSISAGLDYPGRRPRARLTEGRGPGFEYVAVTDEEALEAFRR